MEGESKNVEAGGEIEAELFGSGRIQLAPYLDGFLSGDQRLPRQIRVDQDSGEISQPLGKLRPERLPEIAQTPPVIRPDLVG